MVLLYDVLNSCIAAKGQVYSHTSIGAPQGAYNIRSVNYDDFLDAVCESLSAGNVLYLTEKPGRYFPVIVDLDFRFDLSAGEHRRFDADFVESVVKLYASEIFKAMELAGPIDAYVMQRSAPYVSKGVVKDGLHIAFPHITTTATVQAILRDRVLARLPPLLSVFEDLLNPAGEVLDAHTTENNWQMYGCRKPGRDPYLVSQHMSLASSGEVELMTTGEPKPDSWKTFVHMFAVRKNHTRTTIMPDVAQRAMDLEMEAFRVKRNTFVTRTPGLLSATPRSGDGERATDEELDTARGFASMLAPRRAEAYDSWIRVGWALRNTDQRLLCAWEEFSRKSEKYVEGECGGLWAHMQHEREGGLTMRSLRHWAKEDSPTEFQAFAAESRQEVIMGALSGTHNDIARLVQTMYAEDFVCSSLGHRTFFQFLNHRWRKLEHGHAIRMKLSTEVFDEVKRFAVMYAADNPSEGDGPKKDPAKRTLEALKSCNQKELILRECGDLFYRRNFENALDENKHLLGFENGVYDLRNGEFRDGRPEDMLSLSTGVHYETKDGDEALYLEIMDFFCKVFPNERMRDYTLGRLASFLSGDVSHEHFYIFTGSGSNGKSKTIELFEASFGEYCCKLPTALLTQRRAAAGSALGELARTKARRLAVLQEPGESERLNVGVMKELSGGDTIICRALYSDPIEFRPQFSMVLTCNTLPAVPDNDGGTWRRIRVIQFDSKFVSEPTKTNEFEMDPDLNAKFQRWKRPFMMMLVKRCVEDQGKKLVEPPEVLAVTEKYRAEQDMLSAFIAEHLQRNESGRLAVRELFGVFKDWSRTMAVGKPRPEQIGSMVTKFKATALGEPEGEPDTPVHRHVYVGWSFIPEEAGFTPQG
jgi:P4 family phage/plasmid primase-like protien